MRNNFLKTWSLTLVLLLVTSCGDGYKEDYCSCCNGTDGTVTDPAKLAKDAEKRADLEKRAAAGDEDVQQKLNACAFYKVLGFTDDTGRAYLEKNAATGDLFAQRCLISAADHGKLGFTNDTGRAYLEERAKAGDKHAQEQLNEAEKRGKLGFRKYSAAPTTITPSIDNRPSRLPGG